MNPRIESFLETRPRLYDFAVQMRRRFGHPLPLYHRLDEFSRAHNRRVNFIQLGANDGLGNDLLREFIIRDHWRGILVEPIPRIFELLKKNYRGHTDLVFVNAAVSVSNQPTQSFWTFRDSFLVKYSIQEQLAYLRKSSLSREHIELFVPRDLPPVYAIQKINIPSFTLDQLLEQYWQNDTMHLLAVDIEGYEAKLLRAIDFEKFHPASILFESQHLHQNKSAIFELLQANGYNLQEFGPDTFAKSQK